MYEGMRVEPKRRELIGYHMENSFLPFHPGFLLQTKSVDVQLSSCRPEDNEICVVAWLVSRISMV